MLGIDPAAWSRPASSMLDLKCSTTSGSLIADALPISGVQKKSVRTCKPQYQHSLFRSVYSFH